jgi:hypothetical protein
MRLSCLRQSCCLLQATQLARQMEMRCEPEIQCGQETLLALDGREMWPEPGTWPVQAKQSRARYEKRRGHPSRVWAAAEGTETPQCPAAWGNRRSSQIAYVGGEQRAHLPLMQQDAHRLNKEAWRAGKPAQYRPSPWHLRTHGRIAHPPEPVQHQRVWTVGALQTVGANGVAADRDQHVSGQLLLQACRRDDRFGARTMLRIAKSACARELPGRREATRK